MLVWAQNSSGAIDSAKMINMIRQELDLSLETNSIASQEDAKVASNDGTADLIDVSYDNNVCVEI